ncbi:hypothetical protein evm_014947, partial [Chilo suppressalis]
DIRSTANLIKASLGSGLLAGPLAFANAGWGIGIIGTVIIGIICGHCIHILVKTSRGCCVIEKKPSLGYAETCKSAFENGPKCVQPFANAARLSKSIGHTRLLHLARRRRRRRRGVRGVCSGRVAHLRGSGFESR